MPELTADQRRELEALRRAYEAELPEKITRIAEAAAVLSPQEWDAAGVRLLHQLVHRLAGSSAIWGFTAVSQAAGELEVLVQSTLETGQPPAAELTAKVRRILDALQRATAP